MPKLEINQLLVQNLITEVAPLVTRMTGWDLDIPHLRVRVLPRNQGYEEVIISRLQQLGISGWEEWMPGMFERMIETMVEQNILAAYLPGKGEIVVIRENVDDSNLDGLKLILAHELVHRGQHQAHEILFIQVDQLLKQAFRWFQSADIYLQAIQQIIEQIQPVMTLLESHAAYIQGSLKENYFPNAKVETPFNIAVLLMKIIGAQKIAQYSDGLPEIAEAVALGKVDALYARLVGG
jgi:hypothetical protein